MQAQSYFAVQLSEAEEPSANCGIACAHEVCGVAAESGVAMPKNFTRLPDLPQVEGVRPVSLGGHEDGDMARKQESSIGSDCACQTKDPEKEIRIGLHRAQHPKSLKAGNFLSREISEALLRGMLGESTGTENACDSQPPQM